MLLGFYQRLRNDGRDVGRMAWNPDFLPYVDEFNRRTGQPVDPADLHWALLSVRENYKRYVASHSAN